MTTHEKEIIKAIANMKEAGLSTDPIMRIFNGQGDETLSREQLETIAQYEAAVRVWKAES